MKKNQVQSRNRIRTIDSFLHRSSRLVIKGRVESELQSIIDTYSRSDESNLFQSALFPGRRLRPLLFYSTLDCEATAAQSQSILDIAVCIEIGHRASIILDDLIDDDTIRRGTPAFHRVFPPDTTSLAVVALIGESVSRINRASRNLDVDLLEPFSQTLRKMALGERCDITPPPENDKAVDYYINRVLPKTSALFEFIFQAVASIKNLGITDPILEYSDLGRRLGEVYQIYNDLHDVAATSEVRGSRTIRRINLSLPVAVSLDYDGNSRAARLLRRSVGKRVSTETADRLRAYILRPDNISIAKRLAETKLQETYDRLSSLSNSRLTQIPGFLKWIQQEICWDQSQLSTAGY